MSLFTATLLVALALIAFGGYLAWGGGGAARRLQAFPRSRNAAYATMGVASVWFLHNVLHLGPADFGQWKELIFAVALGAALGSFVYVPDFLAVRGGAALTLLCAGELLSAAFLKDPWTRLFLVSFVYLAIVAAIYLGASPFRLRDFLEWLHGNDRRPRVLGGAFAGYGVLLLAVALLY